MSFRIGLRLVRALTGFLYHYYRYCRYAGWRERIACIHERNYKAVKIYHALEKSLSFVNRRKGAGQANAASLARLLHAVGPSANLGFHDQIAPVVLQKFLQESYCPDVQVPAVKSRDLDGIGGVLRCSKEQLSGLLDNPEAFFYSRSSVREFEPLPPDSEIVARAVRIAMKTPSVCNRQPWHVYTIASRELIAQVLDHQNGNRGFGERVPALLIIASDLRAFGPGAEHYQHWIDGGMFSMSLVYALHSLGIASCCLNWSATPEQDLALRRSVRLRGSDSIIMMLAIGTPLDMNLVCASPRRPLEEVLTNLDQVNQISRSQVQ